MIEAIIKPHKLDDVMGALSRVGIQGVTVSEIRGFGRQRGPAVQYRGAEHRADFIPSLRLQIVAGVKGRHLLRS
jgi:nitrogen regulatory protein P-II 1